MPQLIIIQPATHDRVQFGVSYKASWLWASARTRGVDAILIEDVDLFSIDEVFERYQTGPTYLIELSSLPQIDIVRQVFRERHQKYKLGFFGLDAQLREDGVGPVIKDSDFGLDYAEGAFNYFDVYDQLRRRVQSDYDGHLVWLNRREFAPAFFSVGCARKCGYCAIGYTHFPHAFATIQQVERTIKYAALHDLSLHFYDEDFFAHPALDAILERLKGSGIKWICLTTSVSLSAALEKYGEAYILECGNVLNEVGIETTSAAILDKKQALAALLRSPLGIFWLTVTFFPNERLETKRQTGKFLKAYGYEAEDLLPRLLTNSSHGGLGQFYVPYIGTPWYAKALVTGHLLEPRPTRLWPGYIPDSFLQDIPVKTFEDIQTSWMGLYPGVLECWESILEGCNGQRTVQQICGKSQVNLIAMAQLAQLGAVTSKS